MPFKSDAQRRFMYAKHPRIAARWQKETPNKDLPEKVGGLLCDNGGAMLSELLYAARSKPVSIKNAACGITLPKRKPVTDKDRVVIAGLSELYKRALVDPAMDEQRKQDLHIQQLQFAEDRHDIELQKMQLELQQKQQQFELQQQHSQAEMEAKQNEMAMKQQALQSKYQQSAASTGNASDTATKTPQSDTATSEEQPPVDENLQRSLQYQSNLMKMSQVDYDAYGNPVMPSSPIPPVLGGAVAGGLVGHHVFPNPDAVVMRDLAKGVSDAEVSQAIRDINAGRTPAYAPVSTVNPVTGNKYTFSAPAHVRRKFYKDMALRLNGRRLLAAIALGAAGGYGLHEYMKTSGTLEKCAISPEFARAALQGPAIMSRMSKFTSMTPEDLTRHFMDKYWRTSLRSQDVPRSDMRARRDELLRMLQTVGLS